MEKKRNIFAAAIILALALAWFFRPGFLKNGTAFVESYAVSQDGKTMTLRLGVASSAGFLRKLSQRQQQGGKLYLDCYNAFGGVNGSVGAKAEFTVPLREDTTVIAIYRNADCYEAILEKDAAGSWQRVEASGS